MLDTCEALPEQKGYNAMTVGDIGQGADITRGALYFYYGSKQEVVTGTPGPDRRAPVGTVSDHRADGRAPPGHRGGHAAHGGAVQRARPRHAVRRATVKSASGLADGPTAEAAAIRDSGGLRVHHRVPGSVRGRSDLPCGDRARMRYPSAWSATPTDPSYSSPYPGDRLRHPGRRQSAQRDGPRLDGACRELTFLAEAFVDDC
ncbi:helix-turn-helix domain-containing protein [Nocardia testacea]|uniref:helix-turn-helix domain-containing protein n=1 Tax=Nocardia testacea TaxID=248551 RepID=UPI003A8C4323